MVNTFLSIHAPEDDEIEVIGVPHVEQHPGPAGARPHRAHVVVQQHGEVVRGAGQGLRADGPTDGAGAGGAGVEGVQHQVGGGDDDGVEEAVAGGVVRR